MGPDLTTVLRGLGKFLAVVAASVLVGVGLGIGLSKLSGNDASGESAPAAALPPRAAVPPRPAPTTGATGTTGTGSAKPQAPRIRVLSSTFAAATTPGGRERRRARVTVRVRATARGSEANLGAVRLISGGDALKVDPAATGAAADLLDPIPAGERATGDLRFETAGAFTDRLANELRAKLRIGDRSLSIRLKTP